MTREDLKQLRSYMAELKELEHTRAELERRRSEGKLSRFADAVYQKRLEILESTEREVNELLEAVQFALSLLPSEERRLLELRYIEGLSWREIAVFMGFSEFHVQGYLHKKALRLFES